jgi:hypothetical protein
VIAREAVERDAVIVAAAISAGIHAALAPDHFAEGTGAGLGFLGSAVVLAGLAGALTLRPASPAALAGTAAVFAGLIGSYALAITSGVPLLHPDVEPVIGLALFTKAIEAVGLLAAAHLLRLGRPAVAAALAQPKGTLT